MKNKIEKSLVKAEKFLKSLTFVKIIKGYDECESKYFEDKYFSIEISPGESIISVDSLTLPCVSIRMYFKEDKSIYNFSKIIFHQSQYETEVIKMLNNIRTLLSNKHYIYENKTPNTTEDKEVLFIDICFVEDNLYESKSFNQKIRESKKKRFAKFIADKIFNLVYSYGLKIPYKEISNRDGSLSYYIFIRDPRILKSGFKEIVLCVRISDHEKIEDEYQSLVRWANKTINEIPMNIGVDIREGRVYQIIEDDFDSETNKEDALNKLSEILNSMAEENEKRKEKLKDERI